MSDNYVPHAERLALVATHVTLNGNRAKVSGASNDFATVTDLTSGLSCEWAWPTVRRIVSKGGAFKS